MTKQAKPTIARPFETDYAGTWKGYCATRENAVTAAEKHMARDGYSRCTITDLRTGQAVVRMSISSDRKTIMIEAIKPFRKIA